VIGAVTVIAIMILKRIPELKRITMEMAILKRIQIITSKPKKWTNKNKEQQQFSNVQNFRQIIAKIPILRFYPSPLLERNYIFSQRL